MTGEAGRRLRAAERFGDWSLPVGVVIPCYAASPSGVQFLHLALESLRGQTDPCWFAVVVDDGSPQEFALRIQSEVGKLTNAVLLHTERNLGPGPARNLGVALAGDQRWPAVAFLDADDLAEPRRIARVRTVFREHPEAGLLYSAFHLIDQGGRTLPAALAPQLVQETLRYLQSPAATGAECWRAIGTELGYVTQTSTIAVRTPLALACPFPNSRVSEDSHTWLRMSASGARFYRDPIIHATYRISTEHGSSTRRRVAENYFQFKIAADSDGFAAALSLALGRGVIRPDQMTSLCRLFYERLAVSLEREDQQELANALIARSEGVRPGRQALHDLMHIADGALL